MNFRKAAPRRPGDQPDPLHRRAAGDRDLPDGDHHLQQVHRPAGHLPTADAQKALEQPFEINIAVDANGRYAINNKRIAARDAQGLSEEMQAAVQQWRQGRPGHHHQCRRAGHHQTVINVMEAANGGGYPKLTFAAQSSSKKPVARHSVNLPIASRHPVAMAPGQVPPGRIFYSLEPENGRIQAHCRSHPDPRLATARPAGLPAVAVVAALWRLAALRRGLLRWASSAPNGLPVPVIVVGNVFVGGTGKTPFAIWLIEALRMAACIPA
jgi:biopolymer transport protein ExbD